MSIVEIEEKLSKRDSLTEAEKSEVVRAIYENKEANAIAARGAICMGNLPLALNLIFHQAMVVG